MSRLRVVFMGTPDFAVPALQALVAADMDICAVVSQPDRPKGRGRKLTPSPVKAAALEMGLTVATVERVKDPSFLLQLQEWKPDVVAVVAFGQILPVSVLEVPRLGCINLHASLLPHYRGAAPIHRAVVNGETRTGNTTMQMNQGMDTGDILLTNEVEISPDMTTGELHDILATRGAALLVRTLQEKAAGTLVSKRQDESLATYAPMLNREMERIDWNQSAPAIHNLVRGFNPWPGAYYCSEGTEMKVWRTRVVDTDGALQPGRIRKGGCEGILVETGHGLIELLEVQPQSKRRMGAQDCACGYCLTPGTVLN